MENWFSFNNYSSKRKTLTEQAMDIIKESDTNYIEAAKILYSTIAESQGKEEIISEGFSDFFNTAKAIINTIIDGIKRLFEGFINGFTRNMNRDLGSENTKTILKKFTDEDTFTIDGYDYFIDKNIPVVNTLASFDKDFFDINLSDLSGKISTEKANMFIERLDDKINNLNAELNDDWYDIFRGKVIKASAPIKAENYENELFKLYRKCKSHPYLITVDSTELVRVYNRYRAYLNDVNNICKKNKDDLIREYKEIEKKIEKVIVRNYDKDLSKLTVDLFGPGDISISNLDLSKEVIAKIDQFIALKIGQIQTMSSNHILAFTYKLNALSDCFTQDKYTLNKALNILSNDELRLKESVIEIDDGPDYSEIYLGEKSLEREELSRYLSTLIKHRSVNEATIALNEISAQSIGQRIQSILQFISSAWGKFTNKLREILNTDVEYLNKYKDIILRRRPKTATYKMHNYPKGIKNMVSLEVEMFNVTNRPLMDSLVSQTDFAVYLTKGKQFKVYEESKELPTYFREIFTGSAEKVEFSHEDLNMTDIFNYCINYKNMYNKMQKDFNTIKHSANNAANWIKKISVNNESALLEDSVDINKTGAKEQEGTENSSAARNMNNVKPDSKAGNEEETKANVNPDKESISKANDAINNYLGVVTKLFTAKLNAAEEIYKGYMQIIRSHIKDYVGEKKSNGTKKPDEGTDYKKEETKTEKTENGEKTTTKTSSKKSIFSRKNK